MKRSVRLTSRECGRLCGSAISKLYKHNLRLSTGFQQIARFSTQTQCGGARLHAVAAKRETLRSRLVRFAEGLGYACFKQLQLVSQTRLVVSCLSCVRYGMNKYS